MECFTCITCHAHLRGQPFYALDKKSYCESCYIVSDWTSARWHSLPAAVLSRPPSVPEYIGALLKVLQAHPGPDPASHGEGLPPSLLHLRGLQLLFGWCPLHRGRHLPDPLHRGLPPVRLRFPHLHTNAPSPPATSSYFSPPSLPGRKYAPRCSVCGEPIMPEQGQEETVRIVALDRSFHVNCYVCEVRLKPEPVFSHRLRAGLN